MVARVSVNHYSGASCARTFTGAGLGFGRISANPIRKMPYAVRTPNAIDPSAAQTNMVKFNRSPMEQIHSKCPH